MIIFLKNDRSSGWLARERRLYHRQDHVGFQGLEGSPVQFDVLVKLVKLEGLDLEGHDGEDAVE